MSLRDTLRRYRLYYKSGKDFRRALARPALAWLLPWRPGAARVALRSGRTATLPAGHWDLLPVMCRLDALGASCAVVDGHKRVELAGLTLWSPLTTRADPEYYREVFIDDVYGARGVDRRGQVVVDIGAWVGDSAVAYALAGARVHAVEPLASLSGCIARNAAANGVAELVTAHRVGLAERDQTLPGPDPLVLVEGIAYTLAHLPRAIDVLKIDCEGAEYYLFGNPAFLDHLEPREIRMEYHHGPEPLARLLRERGYQLEYDPGNLGTGLLRAVRPS